jgi:mono/diheme cytochrome c family protein
MHTRSFAAGLGDLFFMVCQSTATWAAAVVTLMVCLFILMFPAASLEAANPAAASPAAPDPGEPTTVLARNLGIHFIPGSSSSVLIERDGRTYMVDLAAQSIKVNDSPAPSFPGTAVHLAAAHSSPQNEPSGAEVFAHNCAVCHGAEGKGGGPMRTPDFTSGSVQAGLSEAAVIKTIREGKPGTAMPAWQDKLSDAQINAVAQFVKSLGAGTRPQGAAPGAAATLPPDVFTPGDDYLFSLPTGLRLDRHGLYLNFTHRFVYTQAVSGPGEGDTLFGLDDFSLSSFGLRFGVTDKLSVSAYRSPSLIDRPIELGVAYHFSDEHAGNPLNAAVRVSLDGQNDFSKNFTPNLELIVSRSITPRAQLYVVPTASFQDRRLISKPGSLASAPPNLPGYNTFSLGVGGALDIRPTVALVAEAIPTLANGAELGIHRPAYAFGIQKKIWRHAFTLGLSNSPGTVVSQRAGTRATYLSEPWADTPGGLFLGFDLTRQIY